MAVCGCRRMQSQESMFFHGYITLKKVLRAHLACLAAVVNLAKNQLREVLIAPCSSSVQVQQTCSGSRHCSAEAARLGLRVRSAVAVRSSSGPTVGIAAAHGPAPPLRRCCTRHTAETAPKKAAPTTSTQTGQGLGGRWPRHLTPSCTHPSPHPKPRYDPVMCRF